MILKIRRRELNHMAKDIGLKFRVTLRKSKRPYSDGAYCGMIQLGPYAGYHVIELKPNLRPNLIRRTLLHELTHALQRERAGSKEIYLARRRQEEKAYLGFLASSVSKRPLTDAEHDRYNSMPTEQEANANEKFELNYPRLVRK